MCSISDPEFIPHATDCQKYYQCAPGHAPVEYSCAGTTRWNTKINNCDYAHNVECASDASGFSKLCSAFDPEFIAHPTDCQKYYHCFPGHEPMEYSCAGTSRWNSDINNCDYAHNVECASNPLLIGTTFEDDMILDQEQIEWLKAGLLYGELDGAIVNETHTVKENMQNSILDPKKLWPNHIVYYSFDDTLLFDQKDTVRSILAALQKKISSCLAFEERNEGNRIIVGSSWPGCWSFVGYKGRNQDLNLANGCWIDGIIEHEFLHAIGLYHHHSRSDRDDHVKIHWDNILDGKERNFNKYTPATISHYGLPYDYESVMHYGKSDFSNYYGQITIETKDPSKQDLIGQRKGLSTGDIELVRRAYGCDLAVKCLTSPEYPRNYPDNSDSRETFSIPDGHAMEIAFHHFDVEAEGTCSYDYLEFFDGNSKAVGKKMCGDSLPQKFQILTSTASAVFHSDGSVTKEGYKFCYSPVKCHTSPEYPQNYPSNYNVKETLSVEAGQAMEITFHSFNVEAHATCKYDYLEFEFIDGNSNTVTKKLCGTSLPQKFTISSSTASAVFRSDASVTKEGYKFCYSPVER